MKKTESTPPSVLVVDAIAEVEGVEPIDLDFVLEDQIDTEALDDLFAHDSPPKTVEFNVGSHHVIVTDDAVRVDGRATLERA
ncbi:HalOD1 output domain-containing protein [Haloarcula marina]|uniref:HalOD1 output domain-containing protein n=1 Tax=Haloarcula marina TaxID=2961574 RepID=UPI0020B741AB|nr:HalOD1 output domain-containing protein [Halomicroarcula marina]